jgi:hypothetical protein
MVPDGASCGKTKMCVESHCTNHSEVVQMVSKCEPESCNDKGICNNVGNCHCVNGYGGPGCDIPGYGGSLNSGPANDTVFNPGLVVLYLLIATLIAFIAATIYYKRRENKWLPKEIWKQLKEALKLRSVRVPTRKAPPPPGGGHVTDVWGDPVRNVLRVGTARTVLPHSAMPIKPILTADIVPSTTYQFPSPIDNGTLWENPALVIPETTTRSQIQPSGKRSQKPHLTLPEQKALRTVDSHSGSSDEQSIDNTASKSLDRFDNALRPNVPPPPPPHRNFGFKAVDHTDVPKVVETLKKEKPQAPKKPPVAVKPVGLGKATGEDTKPDAKISVKDLAAKFNS